MDMFSIGKKIEASTVPKVKYAPGGPLDQDFAPESFLADLVEAKAVVPEHLKQEFLSYWLDDPDYYNAPPGDGIEGVTKEKVKEFARVDPIVNLGPNWS